MGGGDLLNLLIERDIFEEDFTRFYIAEASGSGPCDAALKLTVSASRARDLFVVDGPGCRTMSQTWIHSP